MFCDLITETTYCIEVENGVGLHTDTFPKITQNV